MTGVPSDSASDVSVVMSVYNGSNLLAKALDSILAQEGVTLELIVVNDGSTDDCAAILDEYARRDPRVHVIHQDNTGLTQALIRGCATARGRFIARQDADDVSLPGRLARQVAFLDAHPEAVMTACGVRRFGPEGEDMGERMSHGEELHEGLGKLTVAEIAGPPHHGGTMFRRSAYEAIGGYRAAFRVAQDIDLWLRLAEAGECLGIPEVLYHASWRLGSISHLRLQEQIRTTEVLLECARVRRAGGSDAPILALWAQKRVASVERATAPPAGLEDARFYYFVAGSLRRRDPLKARSYYRRALKRWPFFLRARVWLLLLSVRAPRYKALSRNILNI
jgi:glycosyltransferase involved in cell wall biosynthesis